MRLLLLAPGAALAIACSSPPAATDGQPSAKTDDPAAAASNGDAERAPSGGASAAPTTTPPSSPAPAIPPCDGATIADFADRLVNAARTSCTSDGVGVVTDTNYACMQKPIADLAPPYPDAAFARIEYWAKNGNNFAGKTTLFQCVDFAFAVTAGVCGTPINNGDAQIDENMNIPGYTYMSRTSAAPAPGDVLVMDGHIAITAAVTSPNHVRVAEANCLTVDGRMTDGDDTGVISNTRTDTMTDSWIYGWYRKQ